MRELLIIMFYFLCFVGYLINVNVIQLFYVCIIWTGGVVCGLVGLVLIGDCVRNE
jgi:hypothetical protein